jgi:mRNA interferase MazF
MKGKIVLVPFPFTDLTAAKLRPALVIYEGEKDAIMAFISSKIPSEPSEVDEKLKQEVNPKLKRIMEI